jgi:hypothetical protein
VFVDQPACGVVAHPGNLVSSVGRSTTVQLSINSPVVGFRGSKVMNSLHLPLGGVGLDGC